MKMVDKLKEIAKDPEHKILIGGAGPVRLVVRIREFGDDYIDCMVSNTMTTDTGRDRCIRLGAINDFADVTGNDAYVWSYTEG